MNVYSVTNANGELLSKLEVNELLKEMGISDDAIKTGTEEAIEEYAKSNNVDLTQLTDLALKEGATVSGSADKSKEDYANSLELLGIPADVVSKGDDAVQAYATQNGIILPRSIGTQLNVES